MVVQRNTGDWRPPAINNNWNCRNVVGYGGLKDHTVLPTYIHFKISLYLVKDRWLHIFIIIKCNFQHNETYLFFLNPLCFKSSWQLTSIHKSTKKRNHFTIITSQVTTHRICKWRPIFFRLLIHTITYDCHHD